MFSESCTSVGEGPFHPTKALTDNAMSSKGRAIVALKRDGAVGDFHSRKIKAALMGRMSRMWVYCSSRNAKANADASGRHQTATPRAAREKKNSSGDDLNIDSGFGLVKIFVLSPVSQGAPYTVTRLYLCDPCGAVP